MRNRFTWAHHKERVGDEKLAKRADAQRMEGKGGEEDRNLDRGLH